MNRRTSRGAEQLDLSTLLLWAVRIGVLLVLLTPLVVSRELYFPFVVGKALYSRFIIEVTFALWVALVLFYPRHRPSWSWIVLVFGIWVTVSWVAGLLGVSPIRSMWSTYERMQGVFDLAHWFVFVLVAGSVFRTLGDWKLLFSVNLAVSTLLCILGLGQHYDFLNSDLLGSGNRVASTLGNPTYVGAYAIVNVVVGLALLAGSFGTSGGSQVGVARRRGSVRRRNAYRRREGFRPIPWLRVLLIGAIAVNFWAMWLSGTRGAVAGLAAGLLAFSVAYLLYSHTRRSKVVAVGVLAAVVIAGGVVIYAQTSASVEPNVEANQMLPRLLTVSTADDSVRGRLAALEAASSAFQDRPLLGWGPENFLIAWGRYFDPHPRIRENFDQAHSKVIEELTTKGALGLLAYLATWTLMTLVIVRSIRIRTGNDQLFVVVVGATLTAYFVQNLFLFDTPTTVMQFCLLTAFAVSQERIFRTDAGRHARSTRWVPTGIRDSLDRLSTPMLSRITVASTAVVVAGATIASLVLFNIRPYYAASSVADALRPNQDWSEKVTSYSRSIETFPGLANYARIHLVNDTRVELEHLPDASFRSAVRLVQAEGARGLREEPYNWRLEAALARFFQVASFRDPMYVETARQHADRLIELAPGTRDAAGVISAQEQLEEILSG